MVMKVSSCNRAIVTTCVFGVLVSTYALYVEMAAEARPGYKALCDLSERASCSRVLTSIYSKGFGILPKDSVLGIPNCIYGIVFYCLMIILTTFNGSSILRVQWVLALTAVASSVYLAYLLAYVLHDLCLVCVSTYFVNGTLALLVYKKIKIMKAYSIIKNK